MIVALSLLFLFALLRKLFMGYFYRRLLQKFPFDTEVDCVKLVLVFVPVLFKTFCFDSLVSTTA